MQSNKINVYFTGKLKSDIDLNMAAIQFAVRFETSSQKTLKILHVQKEILLFKNLEPIKAYEFKSILEDIGLFIRLENSIISQQNSKPCDKNTHDLLEIVQENTGSIRTLKSKS